MFINICVHSNYSLMSSSISIDDIINFAIKNNCEYASIMDINTMYGTFEFYKKVILAKLKPIIGLQILYNGQTKFLVAKNYDGVKNLFIISSNTMTNKPYKLDDFLDNIFVLNNDIA
ncbi:hypothetical protein FACS189459_3260 [Bacilli bacterium]|nr:hypothetical protein FACS189459_3260 [Bacilli bacterium]